MAGAHPADPGGGEDRRHAETADRAERDTDRVGDHRTGGGPDRSGGGLGHGEENTERPDRGREVVPDGGRRVRCAGV